MAYVVTFATAVAGGLLARAIWEYSWLVVRSLYRGFHVCRDFAFAVGRNPLLAALAFVQATVLGSSRFSHFDPFVFFLLSVSALLIATTLMTTKRASLCAAGRI